MFESIMNFLRKMTKKEEQTLKSKDAAKERLHLVLMQDRANVSADFLELMKQEIIEVIKKYIDVDENAIDVRLTNKDNGDGTKGAPALYANIPIMNIKEEVKKNNSEEAGQQVKEEKKEEPKIEENKATKEKKKKDNVETPKTDEEKESQEENIHEDQENQNEKVAVQNTEN